MRYHTTGNSRPHVVQDGYRHTLRVPGPLQRLTAHTPRRSNAATSCTLLGLCPLQRTQVA